MKSKLWVFIFLGLWKYWEYLGAVGGFFFGGGGNDRLQPEALFYSILIEFIGVTLVNKTIQVSSDTLPLQQYGWTWRVLC